MQRQLAGIGAPIVTKPFSQKDVRAAIHRRLAGAVADPILA